MDTGISFANRQEFRDWLTENHDKNGGFWMMFGKTSSIKTLKPDEALEEALCFGWIDGQIKSIDGTKYLKKFTPRRTNSKWSAYNRKIAARLIETGQMETAGYDAIEQAKKAGTWDTPERNPVTEEQVGLLVAAINGTEPAITNFMNMSPSVRKTYTAFYLDAKREETRINRLKQIIERLNKNKKPM